jgi:hypothetical protein
MDGGKSVRAEKEEMGTGVGAHERSVSASLEIASKVSVEAK